MFVADAVDDDCDSEARAAIHHMQHGNEDLRNGLGSVAAFIERNPYSVASTLEWRANVMYSQRPPKLRQVVPGRSKRPSTGASHWRSKSSKYDGTITTRRWFWRGR